MMWVFWVVFMITGYSVAKCINKIILRKYYSIFIADKFNLFLEVIPDGFTVTTFGFFIDSVCVKFGIWKWENVNSGYFGVPFGMVRNCLGNKLSFKGS
jgi:hypothetical protein